MAEPTEAVLLHQHNSLSEDIINREKIVWTIGGILIPAAFLLTVYSLTNINNIAMVLAGGIISIALVWFFYYLNVSYSHINKKKIIVRDKIENKLDLTGNNYVYKHDVTYVGRALFIIIVILLHLTWSFIWLCYGWLIENTINPDNHCLLFATGLASLISLICGTVSMKFYNDSLIEKRKSFIKDIENAN